MRSNQIVFKSIFTRIKLQYNKNRPEAIFEKFQNKSQGKNWKLFLHFINENIKEYSLRDILTELRDTIPK